MTGAEGQPAPTSERSRVPLTFRHDDVTVQVPTRSPPQAVTFEHDVPAPPVPGLPPAPTAPPLPDFPPVPDVAPDPEPHAIEIQSGPDGRRQRHESKVVLRHITILSACAVSLTEDSGGGALGERLRHSDERRHALRASVSDTREFATVTPEPGTRFLLAEVSQGMSVHGRSARDVEAAGWSTRCCC